MPDDAVAKLMPKAAGEYLEQGCSVIPLMPQTKIPAIKWAEFQKRKPKELELMKWWSVDHPECNWAIVTGKISGLVVLDFDTPEAEDEAKKLGLPDTATVKTPRGRHYYFKHPGGKVPNRTGIIEKMDVRGDGGYVVAPPSIVGEGAQYKWEKDQRLTELAELPDWVLAKISVDTEAAEAAALPSPVEGVGEAPPADPKAYALQALEGELETLAATRKGQRNVQLNTSALKLGQIVATGALDRSIVETVLKRWALDIGLTAAETHDTIQSGLEAGIREPRWTETARFRLLTVEEIKALPDPEWLINDLIPQGALAILYGEPERGKSFLALDWACSIATGRNWLGRALAQGPSIYICAESPLGFKARIEAWEKERGRLGSHPFRMVPKAVSIPSNDTKDLVSSIRSSGLGAPKLVIIDTLARCFGDGDENVAKDMNAFIKGADHLRDAFEGCTVLVVHHVGKDLAKKARGSTALRGACDTEVFLKGDGGSQDCLLLACEKQKDAERFKAIRLRRCHVLLDGFGLDGSAVFRLRGAQTEPAAAAGVSPQGPTNENDQKAFEALKSAGTAGWTHNEWRSHSGVEKGTFKNVRKRLVGQFVVKDGDRYRVVDRFQGGSSASA